MRVAFPVLVGLLLLAGCGLSDQGSFMPGMLRQPDWEPAPPDPEPDVKELVGASGATLFATHPRSVAVSRARRKETGRGFTACVKAMVDGPVSGRPEPLAILVNIEHGKIIERRRATAQDGCEAEAYEPVALQAP